MRKLRTRDQPITEGEREEERRGIFAFYIMYNHLVYYWNTENFNLK
jgi:hypothetical protein